MGNEKSGLKGGVGAARLCVCVRARWDRGQSVTLVFAKSARDAEMMDRQKEGRDGEGAEREGSVAHLQTQRGATGARWEIQPEPR